MTSIRSGFWQPRASSERMAAACSLNHFNHPCQGQCYRVLFTSRFSGKGIDVPDRKRSVMP